jgi:hypothetical protein
VEGATVERRAGPRAPNPFLAPVEPPSTPFLPGLVGGPEVFGLLAGETVHDLPALLASAPPEAAVAVARFDGGLPGDPVDYVGFDLLVFANLCSQAASAPRLGVGRAPIALLRGGPARNPFFVPGAAPEPLATLPGAALYATLVLEGAADVTFGYDAPGGPLERQVVALADGEAAFLEQPGLDPFCLPEPGATARACAAGIAVAALARARGHAGRPG